MSGRRLRIGIAGLGRAFSIMMPALADPRLEVVAGADPRPEARARFAADFEARAFETVEELCRDPAVEAVYVSTPHQFHRANVEAAAVHGKHVLVEKPMALSLADADAMIAAAEAAGVRLGVALQRRAEPQLQRLHAAVAAGELGRLTLGLVSIPYHRPQSYYDQAGWRGTWAHDGGGVLMNQGIHLIDLLLWLMGDPVEVQARAATLQRAVEVEDTLAATLRFAGGALATVAATTTAEPGFPHRVEVFGTRGGAQLEGEGLLRWHTAAGARHEAEGAAQAAGAGGDPRGIAPIGHIRLLRDLIGAVREGRPPLVDGAEGRRSLAAVLAIYRAAGLGPGMKAEG